MIRFVWICFGLILLSGNAFAEDVCPWINRATAFGILADAGKPTPQSTMQMTPDSCTFTYRSGNKIRELTVLVVTGSNAEDTYQQTRAQCVSGTSSMVGIGNEAVSCVAKSNQFPLVAKAVGRVRDSCFDITIASSDKSDPFLKSDTDGRRLMTAAGQVAGNLF